MIFELNKENIALAREEVLALAGYPSFLCKENILVCKASFDWSRLAYTTRVFEEIFVSDHVPENIPWDGYVQGSFCVRCTRSSKEPAFARMVWQCVKSPRVDLKHPETILQFFLCGEMIICGKQCYQRKEKFHLRRPDLRPGFFPVSLKPKLARCLVNLSGVQKGIIWDPFCGTGGILLEAALLGLETKGSDSDKTMIRAAKKNFEHYGLQGSFTIADAREARVSCDAIVTDPPYGRRASLQNADLESLLNGFLRNSTAKRIVLMTPSHIKLACSSYTVLFETDEYVHGSLTRTIRVLEKS